MNSFVQPYTPGIGGPFSLPLYDPREVRRNRDRFRRDAIPLLERANSIYVPTGRWASRGWILLKRSDYDKLRPEAKFLNTFELNIGDTTNNNNVATFRNLSIVHAQCVTKGITSDPNAIYLVEITDGRGILHNKWFQSPLTAFYNIRSPAYTQEYYSLSLNAGVSPWSWSGMLQDMWNKLNAIAGGTVLGTWPGLPVTPTGTPEGWWFLGVPGWYALNDVLEYRGMTIACDLTQSNPFTIVNAGAADANFVALQTKYIGNLEDDQEWSDVGAGRVPLTVNVLFRRRNQYYGTEETVRNDSLQWETTPYYQVSIAAPSKFSSAVGLHYLWSDFTVQYDIDGNPITADTTTAATIAAELVTQYFAEIYGSDGYMSQMYAGALPFRTGSQVDGVCWSQNYQNQERQGWKTEIVHGKHPPWLGIWDDVK